ncbi:MAG: hypothetical protein J6W09_09130 [Bacteroidales bacterium]|nr:hypothetical protein [Bacteroidales bacterium]
MKKFFITLMAAVMFFIAATPANAGNFMPAPDKGPVEQFISLFNRFFVLNYMLTDLDATAENQTKIEAVDQLADETVATIVDLFDTYGKYVLTASEKVQIANFIDVLYTMSEGETDARSLARIKNQIYSMETMSDLYDAIIADETEPATPMLTYTYKDITLNYPKTYKISTEDTTYGIHIYLQHDEIVPNSVFMEIEKIDAEDFASLPKNKLEKFLRDECQKYYDRYINSDYKISWKSTMSFYDDTNMAIIAVKGTQYGYDFTGEFLTLIHGNYQFTAFITGSDDENEKEARNIFLSALEN